MAGSSSCPPASRGDADLAARPIAPPGHWNLRLVVAATEPGQKKVGSTEGMERSRKTSPFYDAWLKQAPKWARKIKRAIKERDLDTLGSAMEQSTLAFHCCAITSDPPILYWAPATLAALGTVRGLRERGVSVWATMDAGPHVKALCGVGDASRVRQALDRTLGCHTHLGREGRAGGRRCRFDGRGRQRAWEGPALWRVRGARGSAGGRRSRRPQALGSLVRSASRDATGSGGHAAPCAGRARAFAWGARPSM